MKQMNNQTQLDRYKRLITFINQKFKEHIQIEDIEEAAFYSYRNINRIFNALHHETIGQYIKRLRLEKAAEYLKYSDKAISDIALDIGYSDLAAFSKAFKAKFQCSPAVFRNTQQVKRDIISKSIHPEAEQEGEYLNFEIEALPEMQILYLEYHGNYEHISAIKNTWEKLLAYALKHQLLQDQSILLAEILDDNDITDHINCRYHAGLILEKQIDFSLEGLFKTKTIAAQKYAKFIHKGSHESSTETYDQIYAQWIHHAQLELADQATLEFYPNDDGNTPEDELITEIYIPIIS